ncbi:unnamed protein product [Ectocarpus sp. 13 AM-2016]
MARAEESSSSCGKAGMLTPQTRQPAPDLPLYLGSLLIFLFHAYDSAYFAHESAFLGVPSVVS